MVARAGPRAGEVIGRRVPFLRTLRRAGRGTLIALGLRKARIKVVPRRAVSASDYARRTGSRWKVVHPPANPTHHPRRFGARDAYLTQHLVPYQELGVLWLDKATIVGPLALVVTREGDLLSSSTFWHDRPKGIPARFRQGEVRRVRGTLAAVTSDYARLNYGHYLMDALPRVALFEAAGMSWDDVDHIHCSVPGQRAGRLLDQLGVPTDRRLLVQPGIAVRADTSVVTSYPGSRRNYPRWLVSFLRERLGVPAGAPSRRLYIPRTTHRRIENFDELWPILERHGFEVFEPGGDEDPRKAFAEAEAVVGGHGAGLADLAFCRPGTRVLELIPDSHVRPFYMTLSSSGDLQYGYLLGEGIPGEAGVPRAHWNYRVDPEEFRLALEETLS
jgi:hypothetical protein